MWTDIHEYESLRVKVAPGGRHGMNPNMVSSGPGRTVMLSQREGTPYVCFRILESGEEFPLDNISVAIPKGVSIATKLQKTTGSRLTPKLEAPAKKGPKNVPRKMRGTEGDIIVQPKRRPGQTKSIVSPVPGVSDGED